MIAAVDWERGGPPNWRNRVYSLKEWKRRVRGQVVRPSLHLAGCHRWPG